MNGESTSSGPPPLLVSIAEVVEVRATVLSSHELLSLAALSSSVLPLCTRGKAFGPSQVFLSAEGEVHITPVSHDLVEEEFHPPEWRTSTETVDAAAAAVFCMGAVLRWSGGAQTKDADLFSLVNVLTVAMVATRPTANRMGQMAKNQLKSINANEVLREMYQEIMGDGSDLMEDDDVSYSSSEDMPVLQQPGVSTMKQAVEYVSDDDVIMETSEEEEEERRDEMERIRVLKDSNMNEKRSQIEDQRSFEDQRSISEKRAHEAAIAGAALLITPPHEDRREETKQQPSPIPSRAEVLERLRHVEEPEKKQTSLASFPPPPVSILARSSFDDEDIVHAPHEEDSFSMPSAPPFKYDLVEELKRQEAEEERQRKKNETPVIAHSPPPSSPSSRASSTLSPPSYEGRVEERAPASPPPPKPSRSMADSFDSPQSARHRPAPIETKPRSSSSNPFDDEEEERSKIREEEEEERPHKHVDAVVIHHRTPSSVRGMDTEDSSDEEIVEMDEVDRAVPPPQPMPARIIEPPSIARKSAEKEESDVEDAFREAIAQRKASQPGLVVPAAVAASTPSPSGTLPRAGSFNRRNSLASNRISGRQSKRRPRKTRAEPEFVEKEQLAAIRLKAPSSRKKSLLARVENTSVQVRLLDGQIVEVACRSDAITSDIFSLIVTNTKLSEHVFFGLCTLRDGEQFFLDEEQKLEKMAPPGWKSAVRGVPAVQYILHLRFRFYPTYVEFIKTPGTLHALYLQLRRDLLDSRIEPRRDIAFDLAALALQAEFGDRPPLAIIDYFSPGHYLAPRFVAAEDPARLRSLLSELHSHYAGTKEKEAQLKFIEMCQRLPDYGCHSYRVFRSKAAATSSPSPFDSDSGAALWIGIMPKGIVVSESQMGQRAQFAEHPWQRTHTLQFDKKRFVIVDLAVDADGDRKQSTFFTDHHSKSAYFVRFAASQHRFMIKMRQWKNQLKNEKRVAAMPDVAAEGRPIATPLENADKLFDKIPSPPTTMDRRKQSADVAAAAVAARSAAAAAATKSNGHHPTSTLDNSSQHDRSFQSSVMDDSANNSMDHHEEEVEGEILDLEIVKDPNAGLGLTLVDGQLNGLTGVYVKSVNEGGAGQKSGLAVGDRILSVNGESLIGKDRHRAVQLVKESASLVAIQVSRIHGIVSQHKTGTLETTKKQISAIDLKQGSLAALAPPKDKLGASKGGSRTPPAPRKALQKRTLSDFGAVTDALPELNSEDILADMKNLASQHMHDSDEETSGEYRLPQNTSLYGEGDELDAPLEKLQSSSSRPARPNAYATFPRRSNLDWADELEEVGEESEDEDDVIEVTLVRNEQGSLGVQVASSEGRCRIQAATAPPALNHPGIKEGDFLVSVNGTPTEGLAHKEIVALLRGGGDKVTLGLKKVNGDQKIRIVLDKTGGGAIGLSLGKKMGYDGVLVRAIGADSIAEKEGRLRVGDKIIAVDNEKVLDETPARIVERLKAAIDRVEITVIRQAAFAASLPRPTSSGSLHKLGR
ncbi:hypothetical protein PMAYCL1PPCAC_20969 [Pristionchus mayeri]|uniref:Frm-5.1 n=1 Tax=Pristionchus mayeri TaxID=1317129 RepID=A0AAN5I3Y9_9BILA|nr:hypothetical protein PMAYCL1PPCAC_20969 [Pristionchus mayeri]